MSAIQQDVELLRQQLQQAEKQLRDKEEKERLEKEETWEYNMDIIKDKVKTANIKQNRKNWGVVRQKRAAKFYQDYGVYGFERAVINDRRRQAHRIMLEHERASNSRRVKDRPDPEFAPIPYREDREGREYIWDTELDASASAKMPRTQAEYEVFQVSYPFMKSVGICLERLERTIKQQQEKIDNLEKLLVQQHGRGSACTDDIVPSVQVLKHRQRQLEEEISENGGSSLAQNPSC